MKVKHRIVFGATPHNVIILVYPIKALTASSIILLGSSMRGAA